MKKKNLNNHTFDYKDTTTLKTFLDSYGRLMPRRQLSVSAKTSRRIAQAVKQARFMALLPYIAR